MKAVATGTGYRADLPIGAVLDVLAPNKLLEEKFREGWRACEIRFRARGMREPPGLHRVGDNVSALRTIAKVAFVGVGELGVCSLQFALVTDRALDDDAWIFLAKPVIDGMTDAGCWQKDRRRIINLSGFVFRDQPRDVQGDVLQVVVVLPCK